MEDPLFFLVGTNKFVGLFTIPNNICDLERQSQFGAVLLQLRYNGIIKSSMGDKQSWAIGEKK
jgi:hypothetical protein